METTKHTRHRKLKTKRLLLAVTLVVGFFCLWLWLADVGRDNGKTPEILEGSNEFDETYSLSFKWDVADIRTLKRYRSLRELNIEGTLVNFDSIRDLKSLERLWLFPRHQCVNDLSPLRTLTSLRTLQVDAREVGDFSPLTKLTKLEHLFLVGPVDNLKPIGQLSNLRSLWLNGARDISAVASLDLRAFKLLNAKIETLAVLADMKELRSVDIGDVTLNDISSLRGKAELDFVRIQGCSLSDFGDLSGLPKLKHLDLGSTSVESLEFIRDLRSIEVLLLEGTPVTDISPVSALRGLTKLDLSGSNVKNIDALENCTRLKSLDLTDTNVRDLSPLLNCRMLDKLHVSENVEADDISTLQRALPECEVIQF